jgi:ssRNA-specific RNase YbeY (16S rRNA maturation enzyme)
MVNVISSSRYRINRKRIRQVVDNILAERGFSKDYVVNVVFVGRIKMKSITLKYKNENVALPVLAFPYGFQETSEGKIIGEVFICYPQAVLLAAQRNKRVEETIIFLIKHGVGNLLKET